MESGRQRDTRIIVRKETGSELWQASSIIPGQQTVRRIQNRMKLDIKDITDFCFCPNYYDLKRRTKDEKNMKVLYDESLHNVFYKYLMALQQGTLENSLEFLKIRWGKEWIKNKKSSQLVLTPSAIKRDTYDAKRKQGINAILTFDELMSEPQFPVVINKPYELRISDDLIITGTWEYIREVKRNGENIIQLVKIVTESNKFRVRKQMDNDLELIAADMAFHQTFNGTAELLYVDIYTKKMVSSYRVPEHQKMLIRTAKSVALSIKNNLRCVSPDSKCYHCEYRDQCLK